jgi:hypothetical protein
MVFFHFGFRIFFAVCSSSIIQSIFLFRRGMKDGPSYISGKRERQKLKNKTRWNMIIQIFLIKVFVE